MERDEILKKLGQVKASIVPDKLNIHFVNKYYTQEGYKALEERLNYFLGLVYSTPTFPIHAEFIGFPKLYIQTYEELLFRIKELVEILFISNIKLEEKNE